MADNDTNKSERNGKHHDQRVHQRLEQGREHKKDHHQCNQQGLVHAAKRVLCTFLLAKEKQLVILPTFRIAKHLLYLTGHFAWCGDIGVNISDDLGHTLRITAANLVQSTANTDVGNIIQIDGFTRLQNDR